MFCSTVCYHHSLALIFSEIHTRNNTFCSKHMSTTEDQEDPWGYLRWFFHNGTFQTLFSPKFTYIIRRSKLRRTLCYIYCNQIDCKGEQQELQNCVASMSKQQAYIIHLAITYQLGSAVPCCMLVTSCSGKNMRDMLHWQSCHTQC